MFLETLAQDSPKTTKIHNTDSKHNSVKNNVSHHVKIYTIALRMTLSLRFGPMKSRPYILLTIGNRTIFFHLTLQPKQLKY